MHRISTIRISMSIVQVHSISVFMPCVSVHICAYVPVRVHVRVRFQGHVHILDNVHVHVQVMFMQHFINMNIVNMSVSIHININMNHEHVLNMYSKCTVHVLYMYRTNT
jgi:hypothetical protein